MEFLVMSGVFLKRIEQKGNLLKMYEIRLVLKESPHLTFPWGWAGGYQPLGFGKKPIVCQDFCHKLLENERNWT